MGTAGVPASGVVPRSPLAMGTVADLMTKSLLCVRSAIPLLSRSLLRDRHLQLIARSPRSPRLRPNTGRGGRLGASTCKAGSRAFLTPARPRAGSRQDSWGPPL